MAARDGAPVTPATRAAGDTSAGPAVGEAVSRSIVLALLVCLLAAGSARAVVVHLPSGRAMGITPRAGIAPASVRGAPALVGPNVADNGTVDFHGGTVVHSSAPYLIFWGPAGSFSVSTETLLELYFLDVAHDSGLATNVYSVLRQYSDSTGDSDYQQTFSLAQAIDDTGAYPPRDTVNCPRVTSSFPTCVTDAQIHSELTRVIAADGLPSDGLTSASELPANAPIYFVVTPSSVNVCAQGPSGGSPAQCADNLFCAYHSSFADAARNVLYASIPLLGAENAAANPKGCQVDSNAALQEPNGDGGDVALKYMSHENSEAITDPLGTGWYDSISGNEVGDNCNGWNSSKPIDVTKGNDPNAFLPTLGGSATPVPPATTGTLFDQLIDGDPYYTQSEWSNGSIDCRMRPSTPPPTPRFTLPGTAAVGSPVPFDPTASSSASGYSSIGWSFGDGTTSFVSTATASAPAPAAVSHVYATAGTHTVTLTLVDADGGLASLSHTVTVADPPVAAFTATPADPLVGTTLSLDSAGSSDPNLGATISSYSWAFGDGGAGAGPTAAHVYSAAGVYLVTLTVTDSLGLSATVSRQIEVVAPPTAAFAFSPIAPDAGAAVSFDGAGSSDPNGGGAISSYSWSFGDGGAATGTTVSHAYTSAGSYVVRLTVTDSFGLVASTTRLVAVLATRGVTASQASLTAIAQGHPKLLLTLSAGVHAPGIEKLVIGLPGGLRFSARGLAKGVMIRGPGGQRLAFTSRLSHGRLIVTLKRPAAAVKVTIIRPAITVSPKLERKVRRGAVRMVGIAVTAIDGAGSPTRLTVGLRVKR